MENTNQRSEKLEGMGGGMKKKTPGKTRSRRIG